jgi:hypothetical protein
MCAACLVNALHKLFVKFQQQPKPWINVNFLLASVLLVNLPMRVLFQFGNLNEISIVLHFNDVPS